MIEAVLFDIDGTLLDTEKQVLAGLQHALKEQKNLTVASEDLFYTLGIPGEKAVADFADSPQEIAAILTSWEEQMKINFQSVKIFPGIIDLLRGLQKKGIKMGIVTSKTQSEFDDEVKPFGLNQYFQTIVTASDTTKHKPNPEPVLKGLENLQVNPKTAIYVGDAVYDLLSGQQAGARFALATWGAKIHSEFTQANYQLQNPHDLLDIVQQENN
ncbi:HAD family hydrolase [Bombilactobacillus bombi]|uniref:HAD family hydrolase n=1 Tax=Bombilactobacillus bombi TaxID=1303590 RepID=UPI000E5969A1|nr:HAD family hydrolase [Bombilactobacillus bombi]AXX64122.1 HAD family hydrolase [Bombilactobacillus bombi]